MFMIGLTLWKKGPRQRNFLRWVCGECDIRCRLQIREKQIVEPVNSTSARKNRRRQDSHLQSYDAEHYLVKEKSHTTVQKINPEKQKNRKDH